MSTLADPTLSEVPLVEIPAKRRGHVLGWTVVLGVLTLLAALAIAVPLYNNI